MGARSFRTRCPWWCSGVRGRSTAAPSTPGSGSSGSPFEADEELGLRQWLVEIDEVVLIVTQFGEEELVSGAVQLFLDTVVAEVER